MQAKKAKRESARPARGSMVLLVSTKKGLFFLRSDSARREWKIGGPHFLGHVIHHAVLDPRDRRTLLAAAKTGHLGPTVFRSTDFGKHWTEASRPPAFPKAHKGQVARTVDHVFWLTPGHSAEPGAWYAGSSPKGLFRSEDGGHTWSPISGFIEHPMYPAWCGGEQDATPDGPKLHSVIVDPRDPRHLYLGMSSGGIFESVDGGADWKPLNAGCVADFLPDPNVEYGHDAHCMRLHPLAPDVLWQQNHCGIYRMHRPEGRWVRVGEHMPKTIGDIGFPLVLHPRDPDTVWVFPMDGTRVWPRTSPGGRPAVYVTHDAGQNWKRLDSGLPKRDAWLTVLRQAMSCDGRDPLGIYFGTTSGEVWASRNEGARWQSIASHLPHVYALEAAEIGR